MQCKHGWESAAEKPVHNYCSMIAISVFCLRTRVNEKQPRILVNEAVP